MESEYIKATTLETNEESLVEAMYSVPGRRSTFPYIRGIIFCNVRQPEEYFSISVLASIKGLNSPALNEIIG